MIKKLITVSYHLFISALVFNAIITKCIAMDSTSASEEYYKARPLMPSSSKESDGDKEDIFFLGRVEIESQNKKIIDEALSTSSNVLHLSHKLVGVSGVSYLCQQPSCYSLIGLDLLGNDIGKQGTEILVNELLPKMSSLRILSLDNNHIGASGALRVINALSCLPNLTNLNLCNNQIGGDRINEISTILCKNTTLKSLNLGGNAIKYKTSKNIAQLLESNSTLTNLNIGSNGVSGASIEPKGAKRISDALIKNTTLKFLDISHPRLEITGRIYSQGAQYLASMLKLNATLTSLDLTGQSIGNEGLAYFIKILPHNQSLNTLVLTLNNIGNAATISLADFLSTNTSLQTLTLLENKIGNKGTLALVKGIKKNSSTPLRLNIKNNKKLKKETQSALIEFQNSTQAATILFDQ